MCSSLVFTSIDWSSDCRSNKVFSFVFATFEKTNFETFVATRIALQNNVKDYKINLLSQHGIPTEQIAFLMSRQPLKRIRLKDVIR